ncbi:hypothetical protein BUALT_Bualt14G0049500 [Buddleja alternifolia]|uniref:EF-hand domain-containing protein n=1 Tax=Buddleja alternifolia TaxID=168488 RepID=A0AAV6WQE4_9LAMI|nr:hypothetical protein BUALT_Bualt14G0049500 [Buddleja alternifolia]
MDGMRKIASAYYARGSEDEKHSIRELFTKLDSDGDGKVSLVEFKKSAGFWLSDDESIFKQLDTNDDGTLDFNEVLALYYMEKKVSPPKCGGCRELLVGSYFSCWLCCENGDRTTDLCCSCYQRGSFKHEHALSSFLDNHSLVTKFRIQTRDSQRDEEKKEMDGMRKIARAYYAQASKDEKNSIQKFFKNIDANGDGKVSLVEFKKSMGSWLSDETIFRQLDTNDDGTLDFDEVLALYYMKKKVYPPKCDGCRALLVGSYFSCWLCFGKANTGSTDLCCSCYHRGTFEHKHALSNFLDNHSFVKKFRIQTRDAQRAEEKKEMDGMRKIARAYYAQASKDERNSIQKFFKNIDANGDGKVSLVEFKKSVGSWLSDETIFRQLDTNDDGTLDFDEVLALYYMKKKVYPPKCDGCSALLVGSYFSCWLCFGKANTGSTDLCCSCYHRGTFEHKHALSNFSDNHSLVTKFRRGEDKVSQPSPAHATSFAPRPTIVATQPDIPHPLRSRISAAAAHLHRSRSPNLSTLR